MAVSGITSTLQFSGSPVTRPQQSGAPAVSSPTVIEETFEEIIQITKRKIAAQVGVEAANDVVDKNGEVDYTKLAKIIADIQAKQTPENRSSEPQFVNLVA